MADDGNLSAEQTDKLIYFQEITHIDSIDECKRMLEAFEWNIESAVQSTFNDQPLTQGASSNSINSSMNSNLNNDLLASQSSLSSSLASITTSNGIFGSSNNLLASMNTNNNSSNDLFDFDNNATPTTTNNNNNNSPTSPSQPISQTINRTPTINNNNKSNLTLPSINIAPNRTLSYHSPSDTALVPRTFFQWSLFIVCFPFKFLFSTFYDLCSFFYGFFRSTPMPIDYDPLANIAEFAIYFNQKYGTEHLEFYQGSYTQAINEAKRDLKFLVVYIHQNDNKDCHKFATETMTNNDLIQFFRNSVIFWACSRDLPEGYKVFNALRGKRCPFLGVIVLKQSRMTLVSKIEGPIKAPELMIQLDNLMAENEADLVAARHDREQRTQTQLIREQQDQAYEESLKADKEKARKKQEEQDAKRKAQEIERMRIEEEKARENEIVNKKAQIRKQLLETPQAEATNPSAIKLIIKLPSGNRFERFFLKTDPVSDLYKFVFSNEECPINFEIATNFPRTVIVCSEESTTSIQESGVNQSMILFVHDLDA